MAITVDIGMFAFGKLLFRFFFSAKKEEFDKRFGNKQKQNKNERFMLNWKII